MNPKLLLILAVGVVVVSGCVGEEKPVTTTPITTSITTSSSSSTTTTTLTTTTIIKTIDKVFPYQQCEIDSDCMAIFRFCSCSYECYNKSQYQSAYPLSDCRRSCENFDGNRTRDDLCVCLDPKCVLEGNGAITSTTIGQIPLDKIINLNASKYGQRVRLIGVLESGEQIDRRCPNIVYLMDETDYVKLNLRREGNEKYLNTKVEVIGVFYIPPVTAGCSSKKYMSVDQIKALPTTKLGNLTFKNLHKGDRCKSVKRERYNVLNNESEMKGIWYEGGIGSIPDINFSNSTVIGVFRGRTDTSEFGIKVIEEYDYHIRVLFQKGGQGTGRHIWLPCHITIIEKTQKPIIFRDIGTRYCETDLDCVPATCCNVKECVNVEFKPDCENVRCGEYCDSQTMDCCDYCGCKCVNTYCTAIVNNGTFK